MEDNLCCPTCKNKFVLPRRHLTKEIIADMPFMPIPRTLSCLHVVCQSCLDEEWQRNGETTVTCPVCLQSENISNIMHLPINIVIARKIVDVPQRALMNTCSKCYDDVKVCSWCFTCSSWYCEFHHQDHKLSLETSKHDIYTVSELKVKRLEPTPTLHPLWCPQEPTNYCSLYCHPCKLLLSTQAVLELHSGHATTNYKDLYKLKVNSRLKTFFDDSVARNQRLENIIRDLESDANILSTSAKAATAMIDQEFESLIDELRRRQKMLKNRVDEVARSKQDMLGKKIQGIQSILSDSKRLVETIEYLEPSIKLATEATRDVLEMYAVASYHTIHTCSSSIKRRIRETNFARTVMPKVSAIFDVHELSRIREKITTLGAVGTHELRLNLRTDDIDDPGVETSHRNKLVPSGDSLSPTIQGTENSSELVIESEMRGVPPQTDESDTGKLSVIPVNRTVDYHEEVSHSNGRRRRSTTSRRKSTAESHQKGHNIHVHGSGYEQQFMFSIKTKSDLNDNNHSRTIVIDVRQQSLQRLHSAKKHNDGSIPVVSASSGAQYTLSPLEDEFPKVEVKSEETIGQVVVCTEIPIRNGSYQPEFQRFIESATFHGVPFVFVHDNFK